MTTRGESQGPTSGRLGDRERSGGASRARGRGCGLGDVAGDAAALLLGEAAPNAVALAVLDGPGQARVTDRAGAAVRERQTGVFLGSREEPLGVDAVARRAVLPQVRWHRILRKTRRIEIEHGLAHEHAFLDPTGHRHHHAPVLVVRLRGKWALPHSCLARSVSRMEGGFSNLPRNSRSGAARTTRTSRFALVRAVSGGMRLQSGDR